MKRKKNGKMHGIFVLLMLLAFMMFPVQSFGAANTTPDIVKVSSIYSGYSDRVTLKWKPVKDVTKYRIYYKPYGQTKWLKAGDVSGSKTSYTHVSSSLKTGKKYTYTVRGYNQKSKKWGKYNTKGFTTTISDTVRNKTYYYVTGLNGRKGGLTDNKLYWVGGTTKVTGGADTIAFYSSFLRGTNEKEIQASKKYFIPHQKRTFKLTANTKYYGRIDEDLIPWSKDSAVKTCKGLNGLGLTMKIRNNTVIWMKFHS